MSASNATAINLAQSEFRSLRAFFLLYISLSVLILGLLGFFYFQYKKEQKLFQARMELQRYGEGLLSALKNRHFNFQIDQTYPRSEAFQSAIYDVDQAAIFSTLKVQKVSLDQVITLEDGVIHFVMQPEFFYLGARYVVIETIDDRVWAVEAFTHIATVVIIALFFLALIGWYSAKLFLRPMHNAVQLLDRFIKDTTHELNTPVAAILSNIETIDEKSLDHSMAKKIRRMKIASQTISTLYDDLTFLVLNHDIVSKDEKIEVAQLIKERIEYFHLALEQKKITVTTDLKPATLMIDRRKLSRLIDNLISNAIKYNRIAGTIKITLDQGMLMIEDSGQGIAKKDIGDIFTRYMRADKVAGGFGIGLNIVAKIAQEYALSIEVESELKKGTQMILKWSKDA